MKQGNIDLYVEQLILHGFQPGDHYLIGQDFEHELGRLLAERGVPPSLVRSGEVTRMDGGSFEAKPGSGGEAIGAEVARAIYGGMSA